MKHDIFICYSSQDQAEADAVLAKLESEGINCWISSRDIETGTFMGKLMDAVIQSRILVLIFSANSNNSEYCLNEVHTAFNKKIPIIPFMIDASSPSGDMEFYLQRFQQIGFKNPLEIRISRLINEIKRQLAEINAREAAAKEKTEQELKKEKELLEIEAAQDRKEKEAKKHPPGKRPVKLKKGWLFSGAGFVICAVIGIILFTQLGQKTDDPGLTSNLPQTENKTTTPAQSIATTDATTPAQPITTTNATTPATSVKDTIVVGMARSYTGSLAAINDAAFGFICEKWLEEVNAGGGIYVKEYGKKLPIELITYDDESDIEKMSALTEKLILEDKVDFLWPACGTDMIFRQASIANNYSYILIAAEGASTSLRQVLPSLPYVFISLSFADWNQMPVLADMLVEKGCKSAFIVYPSDLSGSEYNSVAGIELGRVGIQVLGTRAVQNDDSSDMTQVIEEAKTSGADIFLCLLYPPQLFPAIQISKELNYNPDVWLGGPGVNFGFFNTVLGPDAEGILGWTNFSRKSSTALSELADKLYSDSVDMEDWWGHALYWAGLDAWKAAIEIAGTLDQSKIRDVLATQHLTTVLGDTWFVNGLLAKETHPGEVGQWQNGVYEVVGPSDKATAEFIFPKPAWPQ